MAGQPGDVRIQSTLSLKNDAPAPVARTADLLGTVKIVADLTARDAIPDHVRVDGVLCYVVSNTTWYQLVGGITNGDWQVASIGGGGGGGVTPQVDNFTGSLTNGQTAFTLSQTPSDTASLVLIINSATYTTSNGAVVVSGTSLTWAGDFNIASDDEVEAHYFV